MMVSEVERLSREVEALRARVEALEKRVIPVERVSAREMKLLLRRANAPPEEFESWEEVKAHLEERSRCSDSGSIVGRIP